MPRRGPSLTKLAAYCDSRPRSVRTRPFGPEPLVFKTGGKMYALLGQWNGRDVISLKCDPERSTILRASYSAIVPGYHLNKELWNTLVLDGSLPIALIKELIDHSHELVARSPRKRTTSRRRRSARR